MQSMSIQNSIKTAIYLLWLLFLSFSSSSAQSIILTSGQTLNVNQNSVFTSIIGATNGAGKVNFNGSATINGALGGNFTALAEVDVASEKSITLGANSANIKDLDLATSSVMSSSGANTLNLTNAAGDYFVIIGDEASLANSNRDGSVINFSGSEAASLNIALNGDGNNNQTRIQTASATSNLKKAVLFNNANADLTINNNSGNINGGITIEEAKSVIINANGAFSNSGRILGDVVNNSAAKLEVNLAGNATISGLLNMGLHDDSKIALSGYSSIVGQVTLGNATQNISIANNAILFGSVSGAGNIMLKDQSSKLWLNSSTLAASVDDGLSDDAKSGEIRIMNDQIVVMNANIGSVKAVNEVILQPKSTLDLATNNKSVRAENIFLDTGSKLKLGSASVEANISNSSLTNGAGIVIEINGENTLKSNVAIGLGNVEIAQNSTLNLDDKEINAAAVLMNQGAILNVQAGIINSDIIASEDGFGTVNFTYDGNFDKNIGTIEKRLASVSLASGKKIDLGAFTTINAINISIGDDAALSGRSDQLNGNVSFQGSARLSLDSGLIGGEIDGSPDGASGILYINEDQEVTTTKNIGKTYKLVSVELGASATLNLDVNNNNLGANSLILNDGSTLNVGSQAIDSNITASLAGVGVVNFKENNSLAGNVGLTNIALAQLNISANKTLSNGTYNINANQILLNLGAVLKIGSGAVTGQISGAGAVELEGANISGLTIGTNNQNISSVSVNAEKSVNLSNSTIYTNQVRVLENSALTLGSATNIYGDFVLNENANLTINDGANFASAVKSSSNANANGSLNINARQHVVNYAIGDNNNFLNQVNVTQNSSATIFSQINSRSTNIYGTANFNNSQGNKINGDLNVANGAVLNLFDKDHSVAGNLNVASGAIIKLEINQANAGSITAAGLALINSGTLIQLTIDPTLLQEQIKSGLNYTIISGATGSDIGAIAGTNISLLNNSTIPNLKFSTIISNNSLILNVVQREDQGELGKTDGQRNLYRELLNLNNVNGNLLSLKQLLLNSQNRAFTITALEAANPQIDNSINRLSFENSSDSLAITSKRINALRGVASGLGMSAKSAWVQTFGSRIHQGNTATSNGYNATTQGLLIGFDKEIEDDLILGTSLSYVDSSINSIDNEKSTNLDSYQLNVYGAKDFSNYFINAMLGVVYNKYSSIRKIAIFNAQAKAQYSGQTYVSRIEAGSNFVMKDDYIVTPLLVITMAKNFTDNYQESGAPDLNFNIKNNSTSFFETRAGVNVSKALQLNRKQKIQPNFGISYGYDFAGSKQKTRATFVGQDAGFDVKSANIVQGSLRFEVGSKILYMNAFSFDAVYNFDLRNNYHAHSASVRGKYDF